MKANGLKVKPMAMVSILIEMVVSMKDIGKRTNRTEKEKRHGRMGIHMKETLNKGKKVGKDCSNGRMVLCMKESS